jgi:predicted amidophosphoribosyltransferase
MFSGPLRQFIRSWKYGGQRELSLVLGRLLTGYLLQSAPTFDGYDLIVGCPGRPSARRRWDPIEDLFDVIAAGIADLWPIAGRGGPVIKTAATVPLVAVGRPAARRLWAAVDLRRALAVTDPAAVVGRRILVIDDVLTDGSTLREVAFALQAAGAIEVSALVAARQPWLGAAVHTQ